MKTEDIQNENKSTGEVTSQSTILVNLVKDVELWHTKTREVFATYGVKNHLETYPLREGSFRSLLLHRFYQENKKVPGSQAVQDALATLEAKALFEGPEHEIFTRIGQVGNKVYLDLVDSNWQVVEITADGWKVLNESPIKFRRSRNMATLSVPEESGSIDDLKEFINFGSDTDFILIISWVIASLWPNGPYPILVLQGEQGSAKSTTARVLRSLVDPNTVQTRSRPSDERDLMVAAKHSWQLVFDNLSGLPIWLSDSFCRLSTGGGFSTRALYTDDEEKVFDSQRPVLINGIEDLATRGDLIERSLIITLPTIDKSKRRTEVEFWHKFKLVQSRILGALLNAVSLAIKNLSTTELDGYPRMADFTKLIVAAEPALDWGLGRFLEAYHSTLQDANDLALESSALTEPILLLLEKGVWEGSCSELLAKLITNNEQQAKNRNWPKDPTRLSGELRRIAPNLRNKGINIEFLKTKQRRIVSIRKRTNESVSSVTSDSSNKSLAEQIFNPSDANDTEDTKKRTNSNN